MPEVSRRTNGHVNVNNFGHDVNSMLYTVTNIYPKDGILLKRH